MDIINERKKIAEFSRSLGCRVTSFDDYGLTTLRQVAGEKVTTHFIFPKSKTVKVLSSDISILRSLRKSNPSCYLRIITDYKIPKTIEKKLKEHEIQISNITNYFNDTLNDKFIVKKAIEDADKYIPKDNYVHQRVFGESIAATEFVVDDWLNKAETSLLVILAPTGQGKTCLAHVLVRMLAEKHKRNPKSPVPILMPLHKFPHVRKFDELVLTHLQDNEIFGFTSAAFAYLVNEKRVIPILDGFDELAEIGGPKVARTTLSSLCGRFTGKARAILTSREAFFRHRGDIPVSIDLGRETDDFETLNLSPFDENEMKLYFSAKGVPSEKLNLCLTAASDLGEDEELKGSPLICWAIAESVKEHGLEKLPDLSGANLFGEILYSICKREVRRQPFRQTPEDQIKVISTIAEIMFDEESYSLKNFDSWLYDIAEEEAGVTKSAAEKHKFIQERRLQLENHALLNVVFSNDDVSMKSMEFRHPFFRDYLIATKIKGMVDSGDKHLWFILEKALPRTTISFLADIVDLVKLGKILRSVPDQRMGFRSYVEIILAKCDRIARDDINLRSKIFEGSLGKTKKIEYCDLSELTFRALRFEGISFRGSIFKKTVFQNCAFQKCGFHKGELTTARFYDCTADEETEKSFKESGIKGVQVDKIGENQFNVSVEKQEDPIIYLVERFFRRFIISKGLNQRTRLQSSIYQGLGGQEKLFTEREIVPQALQIVIIESTMSGSKEIYKFNADWQADGDYLLWEHKTTKRMREFIDNLRPHSERYSLY